MEENITKYFFVPDIPQQNGVAKKTNKTLLDKT